MYIVIAIIAFGLLIAVHELGHFTAAKLLGVRVREFAIGMGPKILKKQGKETHYSLRLLPIGGFCAMDEDEEAKDTRSFTAQKRWRRVIILAAGGFANIIAAAIIIVIIVSGMSVFRGTTITRLEDGFPLEGEDGLMVGDTITWINGERLYYLDDFSLLMQLRGDSYPNLVIERNGEQIKLDNFPLEQREYVINGETEFRYGFSFNYIEANFAESLKHAGYMAINNVRIVRLSLAMLVSGEASVTDMGGPVMIIDTMNTIGQTSSSFGDAMGNIAWFTALIGVNIAVVNFLPIPAVDGGRILFVCINWVVEKITRRKLNPKYEGYVHTATLVLLVGFMIFILVNDVFRIATR